jgi:hypothetical protein
MSYEIKLKSGGTECVDGADAYAQEGPLTTFFRTRDGQSVVDSWARRVASYRTADVIRIVSTGPDPSPVRPLGYPPLELRAG